MGSAECGYGAIVGDAPRTTSSVPRGLRLVTPPEFADIHRMKVSRRVVRSALAGTGLALAFLFMASIIVPERSQAGSGGVEARIVYCRPTELRAEYPVRPRCQGQGKQTDTRVEVQHRATRRRQRHDLLDQALDEETVRLEERANVRSEAYPEHPRFHVGLAYEIEVAAKPTLARDCPKAGETGRGSPQGRQARPSSQRLPSSVVCGKG